MDQRILSVVLGGSQLEVLVRNPTSVELSIDLNYQPTYAIASFFQQQTLALNCPEKLMK
jgi:hypothetical protein